MGDGVLELGCFGEESEDGELFDGVREGVMGKDRIRVVRHSAWRYSWVLMMMVSSTRQSDWGLFSVSLSLSARA